MRKLILAMMLAAMSSMWMTSEAVCAIQAPEGLYQVFTELSGTLEEVGYPCEDGMDCPDCLTVALITEDNNVFYLTGLSEEQQQMIDKALYGPYNAMWPPMPVKATVSGTPYQGGSFDFIKVLDIVFEKEKLHSLCDMWNVLGEASWDGYPHYNMVYYGLAEDPTMTGDKLYYKLYKNGGYIGAMREGENRDIYYIPNGTEHEYLLYAFNAKEGDKLSNLWYGGRAEWCPNGYNATVKRISDTTPREFTIEVEYIYSDSEGDHTVPWTIYWTEGVGMADGPVGQSCPGPECAGDYGQRVLCAYTLGVQVYASEWGEKFGCAAPIAVHDPELLKGAWKVYKEKSTRTTHIIEETTPLHDVDNDGFYIFDDSTMLFICPTCYSVPASYTLSYFDDNKSMLEFDRTHTKYFIYKLTPTEMEWEYTDYSSEGSVTYYQYLRHYNGQQGDTIPLYAQDDPGSSTVDPVDPNQIVATLKGDELTIRESSGDEITYNLERREANDERKEVRGERKAEGVQSDTFHNSVTIQLTEDGVYQLELTNPSWDYIITGTFRYGPQGTENIQTSDVNIQKILRDGRLYIQVGGRIYGITGQQIQ